MSTADEPNRSLDRRVVRTPRVGARVCLLIGALMLIGAFYFLLSPIRVTAASGSSWDCGNALNRPNDAFGAGLCGGANNINLAKATAAGAAALVTGIGGFLIFGSDQRVQTRRKARDAEEATP